jgi:fluoride ion exporter CrcB/FEX
MVQKEMSAVGHFLRMFFIHTIARQLKSLEEKNILAQVGVCARFSTFTPKNLRP